MSITSKLNEYLEGIFDTSDIVYRAVVADEDGVPEAIIVSPDDLDQGAIASLLEYDRRLRNNIVDNMDYNNASGVYLKIFHEDVMVIPLLEGETEDDRKNRVKIYIVGNKYSEAAIIDATNQFSDDTPRIMKGHGGAAFADHVFADNYYQYKISKPGSRYDEYYIYPARAYDGVEDGFYFTLILKNTKSTDIKRLFAILEVIVAGGMEYEVVIE